jgi:hypothetical protein
MGSYVLYGDDGAVLIITSVRSFAVKYAKSLKGKQNGGQTNKENDG